MALKKAFCQFKGSFRVILVNVLISVGMIQGVGKLCFPFVCTY